MYDNIGKKIKGLAKVSFCIIAMLTAIAGLTFILIDKHFIYIGLPLMLGGPFAAWISSWTLYGFGELIDKTCDIATYVGDINKQNGKNNKKKETTINKNNISSNNNEYMDLVCPFCHETLSLTKKELQAEENECPFCGKHFSLS